MAIKIYKEKMKYLDKMIVELPQKVDPKDYRATPNVDRLVGELLRQDQDSRPGADLG